MAKKKRPRTTRREKERTASKLEEKLLSLDKLAPGGSPETAEVVLSASVIETRAESVKCPICEGKGLLGEHTAVRVRDTPYRVVEIKCRQCHLEFRRWFRIQSKLPS